jgi:hypothetical protein
MNARNLCIFSLDGVFGNDNLNNVFLSTIWNRTDIAVQKVKHIVFCGYSFPDADIHIKYLLKRAQTNRDSDLTFTVINHHADKDPDLVDQELLADIPIRNFVRPRWGLLAVLLQGFTRL